MKNDNSTKQSNASKPMLANRLLKFRAWDDKQKYMAIQGTPDLETLASFMHHYADCELMQYVGINDTNGKEIYEGDILVYTTYSESGITETKQKPVVINWNRYKSTYDYNDYKYYPLGCYPFYKYWTLESMRNEEVEIIGNIFENPELLTQR